MAENEPKARTKEEADAVKRESVSGQQPQGQNIFPRAVLSRTVLVGLLALAGDVAPLWRISLALVTLGQGVL